MPPNRTSTTFRQQDLLLAHFALFQSGVSLTAGFIGAYLLRSGFSLSAALASYALYLAVRSGFRLVCLRVVRRAGYPAALRLGTALMALQFLPLMGAANPVCFGLWILCVALGEALFWPVYHAATAITCEDGARGRQVGLRMTITALANVTAPLLGAWLLVRWGAAAEFGLGCALGLLAVVPLCLVGDLPAGPVSAARDAFRGLDRRAFTAFAGDGWLSAGTMFAWPMVLFVALGSHYTALGATAAASGLVGAAGSTLCGRGIDRGRRGTYLWVVCAVLAASVAARSAASLSVWTAVAANLSAAAVGAVYVPVLMSFMYDRAKLSGAAFRFHIAMEAAWDAGAFCGCLTAAGLGLLCRQVPSLVMLPAVVGLVLVYVCVRDGARAQVSEAVEA